MRTFVLKLIIYITVPALVMNCSKEIEIKVADEPRVVVNSLFNSDSTWNVSVTTSQSILSDRFSNVSIINATVKVYDENDVLIETLPHFVDKRFRQSYRGTTSPEKGKFYTIKVTTSDKSLQASASLPLSVAISSVEIDSTLYNSQNDVDIKLSFKDPEEKNFYEIKVVKHSYRLLTENDTVWMKQELWVDPIDPAFENDLTNGAGKLFNDRLFNGALYDFRFRVGSYNSYPTSKIEILLLSVSEEYYNYFSTQSLQNNTRDDPFAQPAMIFSNIQNGLGIFAGYSTSAVTLDTK